MHVKFTIGMAINPSLAAEVEIPVSRIAQGPAAIAGQQRVDRLSLAARYFQVIAPERFRRALDCMHRASYTKPCREARAFWKIVAFGSLEGSSSALR
jgi:hypothetical protein